MPQDLKGVSLMAAGLLWACLAPAQLIFVDGSDLRQKPFVMPEAANRAMVQKNKLASSLRYGYLSEHPDAGSLRRRTEYNAQGFPTLIYDFGAEGQIASKSEYSYDAGGTKVIAATIEQYKSNSETDLMFGYKFDTQGRVVEYREVDGQGHERRMAYTFDAQGRPLRVQYIEPDGLPGGAEVYTYHSPTQVSMEKTDIGGETLENVYWTLDAKGRVVSEAHHIGGQFAALLYTYKYKYDERGRLQRRDKYNRNNEPNGWETWTYDGGGRVVEHQILETGELKPLVELFYYDRSGRKTQAKTLNPDGSVFQWFKYSYDSLGTGAGMERLNAAGGVEHRQVKVFSPSRQLLREESRYSDGSGENTILYRYSEDGLPLDEKYLSFGKETAVYWYVHERR